MSLCLKYDQVSFYVVALNRDGGVLENLRIDGMSAQSR